MTEGDLMRGNEHRFTPKDELDTPTALQEKHNSALSMMHEARYKEGSESYQLATTILETTRAKMKLNPNFDNAFAAAVEEHRPSIDSDLADIYVGMVKQLKKFCGAAHRQMESHGKRPHKDDRRAGTRRQRVLASLRSS